MTIALFRFLIQDAIMTNLDSQSVLNILCIYKEEKANKFD